MTWLGLLIGALIGSAWGFKGTLVGALAGALIGAYLRRTSQLGVAPRAPGFPVRKGGSGGALEPSASDGVAASGGQATPSAPDVVAPAGEGAPPAPLTPTTATPDPLWAWLSGGNAMTRIGVVVLFFGVAFLLRYLAEIVVIPIEWKLTGVAVVGLVLIGFGLALAGARPGYGLSLQGAGAGVLYLTTFAAFRLYHVLSPVAGLALLGIVAIVTVVLALRADSQPLAALAAAGGFLAPMLIRPAGEPSLLFGYFAILNAAIFALAWVRSWRALNLLGFFFTFVLGSVWAWRYYRPAWIYFSTLEPFLILFVAFYIGIAILYAWRGRAEARAPVDAILVFGVPLVGFGLQLPLVRAIEYGAAWSACALALVYGLLFLLLRRRSEPGLALLSRAFLVLAAIFAVIAVPLAFDDRIAAALWAVAGAGVFWLGVRQDTPLLRGVAVLVEFGAGAVFLGSGAARPGEPMLVNAYFVGALLLGVSGLVTAAVADRAGDKLPPPERGFIPLLMIWGAGWWLFGGAFDLRRHLDSVDAPHATLAFAVLSVAAALLAARASRWRRGVAVGLALLPAMAWIALEDWHSTRTTLDNFGALVWPIAWVTQWGFLRAADAAPDAERAASPVLAPRLAYVWHALSAIGLVAQIAWEASERVDRIAPADTVWLACAAVVPPIAYLLLADAFTRSARWPFTLHRDAYAIGAGGPIAALVAAWFAIATVVSPGTASPLPWVPLFNPLELTLVLALAALFAWTARFAILDEKTRYGWLGVGLFALLNGTALRTAHHWGGIAWDASALLGSKLLQAGLTLAWAATAVVLMFLATRRALRPLWMIGVGLLAVAVGKLFLIDLASLSGLPRVAVFLGVGSLLLLIGYLSPLPPAAADSKPRDGG